MEFWVKSGSIVVSDPCYDCGDRTFKAKNGRWTGEVVSRDRVDNAELLAHIGPGPFRWERESGCLGVDSGQMSVYDAAEYRGGNDCGWYDGICKATLDDKDCPPGGFACSTAYGDGCYPLFVAKDKDGLVVGVKVVFVDEEGDDDPWGEDEEAQSESEGEDE